MNNHQIIKAAIDNNWAKLNENWVRIARCNMFESDYIAEFATVSIDLGRGSGHTSYIVENAMPDDLIVTSRMVQQQEIYRLLCERLHRRPTEYRFYCFGSNPDILRGVKVRRIWIDNWSYLRYNVSVERYDEAITNLLYTRPEQIIRLG